MSAQEAECFRMPDQWERVRQPSKQELGKRPKRERDPFFPTQFLSFITALCGADDNRGPWEATCTELGWRVTPPPHTIKYKALPFFFFCHLEKKNPSPKSHLCSTRPPVLGPKEFQFLRTDKGAAFSPLSLTLLQER